MHWEGENQDKRVEQVQDFVNRFTAIGDSTKRQSFARTGVKDNVSEGRRLLDTHIKNAMKNEWKLVPKIEAILQDNQRMPYDIMRIDRARKVLFSFLCSFL